MTNTARAMSNWFPEWSFGDRLRKVRTELGYDQREFATLLEMKAPTLSSYESGRANPRSRDLPILASRLELLTGVPRGWFLGWESPAPAGTQKAPTLSREGHSLPGLDSNQEPAGFHPGELVEADFGRRTWAVSA